jgi:hypothetical protein
MTSGYSLASNFRENMPVTASIAESLTGVRHRILKHTQSGSTGRHREIVVEGTHTFHRNGLVWLFGIGGHQKYPMELVCQGSHVTEDGNTVVEAYHSK